MRGKCTDWWSSGRAGAGGRRISTISFLYASLDVDEEEVRKALPVAFSSRGHTLALLAPLMNDATWGTSRGSRNRWKRFRKTTAAPDLPDVIAKLRSRFGRLVLAAQKPGGGDPISSPS